MLFSLAKENNCLLSYSVRIRIYFVQGSLLIASTFLTPSPFRHSSMVELRYFIFFSLSSMMRAGNSTTCQTQSPETICSSQQTEAHWKPSWGNCHSWFSLTSFPLCIKLVTWRADWCWRWNSWNISSWSYQCPSNSSSPAFLCRWWIEGFPHTVPGHFLLCLLQPLEFLHQYAEHLHQVIWAFVQRLSQCHQGFLLEFAILH